MDTKRLLTGFTLVLLLVMAAAVPAQGQDVASDLLGRINGLRASLGLPPYALNGALSAAARNQAQWMARTGQISHTQSDGSTPSSRAQAAGYPSSWVSENIYMGTNATAASAFTWWSNSPIHYRGMTNANYREIGIGWASGPAFNGSTAFVLVFGNPTGYTSPRRSASSGGQSSAAAGPPGLPPYVVGVDNNGYIMHEVQPGHTMGEIALIYGYTWDDLPEIRAVNSLTEEEARNRLEVGSILLIPPWEGTYTPTPGGPDVETQDENNNESVMQEAESTVAGDESAPPRASETPPAPPTFTITPTPTAAGVATSAVVPEWVVETSIAQDAARATATNPPPVIETVANPPTVAQALTTVEGGSSWTAATMTPTPGQTGIAVAAVDSVPEAALQPETAPVPDEGGSGPNPLLIAVAALAVGVLVGFGVAMLRA